MGVIFLITNRVNKQIIPQTKVWIINVIIKYLAHLMYLRWYYTIEIVKIENNFFSLKMSLNIRCTQMTISLKVYKALLAGMWGEG